MASWEQSKRHWKMKMMHLFYGLISIWLCDFFTVNFLSRRRKKSRNTVQTSSWSSPKSSSYSFCNYVTFRGLMSFFFTKTPFFLWPKKQAQLEAPNHAFHFLSCLMGVVISKKKFRYINHDSGRRKK